MENQTLEQQFLPMLADAMNPNNDGNIIDRDPAEPADPARAALVKYLSEQVQQDKDYWEDRAFNRMRRSQRLAAGKQWPSPTDPAAQKDFLADEAADRYVANIILRHIRNRTASLYGKNPKIIARRRERILNTIWDGKARSLQEAVATLTSSTAMGMADPMAAAQAMAVITDAQNVLTQHQKLDKIAKTLELLFQHELDEQPIPFKVQMKALIRRALTTSVGYAKIGYQRVMAKTADVESQIRDVSQKLAQIESLSADLADGETLPTDPEAEKLRLMLKDLASTKDIVVREGLLVTYPESTNIIPDRSMSQLRGFVGCDRVTEQYFLTKDQIQKIYNVDVGSKAKCYVPKSLGLGEFQRSDGVGENNKEKRHCLWEVYDRTTGLVYVICDGYPDFLMEPSAPDVKLERFYPWFAFVVNEVYDDEMVFPPSDVELIAPMQFELNRARQSLREHRRAARPRTVTRAGVLEKNDKDNLSECVANAVIEVAGLQPGEKIEDVLQPWSGPRIDPNLYETQSAFEDILRVSGGQEANFGSTSSATATESSIAEGSRMAGVTSEIDDLDEFLNEFARSAGQVLLAETSVETVRQVVGPGALWPDLRRDEIEKEIYLEIEAASTGRPNKAQEVQNAQALMPLLLQIPGLSPEWIARELIRRMDDRLDLTDAFASGMPSIQALNRMGQMTAAAPQDDPNNQGGEGGSNAPDTKPEQVNAAPRSPVVNAA